MKTRTWLGVLSGAVLMCEIAIIAAQRREIARAATDVGPAPSRTAERSPAAIPPAKEAGVAPPQAGQWDRDPASLSRKFYEALEKPEFRKLLSAAQRDMILSHYDRLLGTLSLGPEKESRLVELIAEKQLVKTDALAVAAEQGLLGSGMTIAAIGEAQKEVDGKIEQLLGADGNSKYCHFETTDALRVTLQRFQESLRYSPEPISDAGVEAMVGTLNENTPPEARGGITKSTGMSAEVAVGLVVPPFTSPLPSNTAELVGAGLSAFQLKELRALMSRQQDELRVRSEALSSLRQSQ